MTESKGWPYDSGMDRRCMVLTSGNTASNVSKLHSEFLGRRDYVPTQTVQGISEQISARTGYY